MIDLYFGPTPNVWKVAIMLEECGLDYSIKTVDILKGDQFSDAFVAVNPNSKIPAIVDNAPADGGDPMPVFESGAILIYLAEKTKRFYPTEPRQRAEVLGWLMWQMGGLGPMLGQHGHFSRYAPERIDYAMSRYRKEALRLYQVLDDRLQGRDYVAGGDYSIADMAILPWIRMFELHQIALDEFANVRRWYDALFARAGVQAGMALGQEEFERGTAALNDEARKILFDLDD